MAPGAFQLERLGVEFPALAGAAGWAREAIRPPELREVAGTRGFVRKPTIEVSSGHGAVIFPAADHGNIMETSKPMVNRILRGSHHG